MNKRVIEELHAKLDWYTREASEAEFDPKAVESILYLLDIYEPLEADADVDRAWERFEKKITETVNHPMEQEMPQEDTCSKNIVEWKKASAFLQKRKGIVAAVLVILLLALVGTTQAEAIRECGFFFWLKQDENGRQMITEPEKLETTLDKTVDRYYDRKDIPQRCEVLLTIENGLYTDGDLQWKYIHVAQVDNYDVVKSFYIDPKTESEVIVGVVSYAEKVTFSTELFEGYSYVESYGRDEEAVYSYHRVEDSVDFYRLCRLKDNHIYYVEGNELALLKSLVEKYLKK